MTYIIGLCLVIAVAIGAIARRPQVAFWVTAGSTFSITYVALLYLGQGHAIEGVSFLGVLGCVFIAAGIAAGMSAVLRNSRR